MCIGRTATHSDLLNPRFAYVSVSRASHDAKIYTDNAQQLGDRLSSDVSKTSAVEQQTHQKFSPTNEQAQAQESHRTPAVEKVAQIAEQRRNPAIDQGIGF